MTILPSRGTAASVPWRALAAASILLLAVAATRAQQPEDPSADAPQWISGVLTMEGTYDDNAMEYSSREISELNNSVHPTKYVVTNSVDAIGSVRARLDITPRTGNPDFRTRLRLRFTGDSYRTNPARDHHTWGIEINQKILGRNYLLLRFTSLPDYYLRNLYYKRYRVLSRAPSHYERATISKKEYTIELGRRMNSALRLAANYEYDRVYYPPLFEERDNSFHGGTIEIDYNASRALRFSLDYGYALRWAAGRDNFADPAYDSLADISSRYHRVEARASCDMKRLVRLPVTVQAGLTYERQSYLSGKPGDIYHYGRRDNYWKFSAELEYELTANVGFFVHYIWEQNRTNFGETGDAGAFQTHIIGTGAAFSI